MKRKGQVTVYIILGFIILIAVGILFFLEGEKADTDVRTEIPGKAQYAGQEELRNFMDTCIQDAVFNGLEIIKLQGGHINIPVGVPTVIVKNDKNEQIIDSNGVKKVVIDPNGVGNQVAYWIDSGNLLHVPSLSYVENSLAEYVENSVLNCVNDFSAFKSQSYDVIVGTIDATAELSEEVLVKITYPITMDRGGTRFEEKEFLLRVPLNLRKAIDLQTDLVLGEASTNFLESDIKYILSLYSYNGGLKDEFDLPPLTFTSANTDCKMVTWSLGEVKSKVIDNLEQNSKYFKVKGIGEEVKGGSDISTGVYKGLTSDILGMTYKDVDVRFRLNDNPDTGVQFDIKPRAGEIIRPSRHTATGINFLPLFCSLEYQFKYSMKFPMLTEVELEESKAIDIVSKTLDAENNFVFEIPMGIFLCGNQNRQCTGRPAYASQEIDIDYEKLGMEEPVQTMFCDIDMRLSQPFKIRVINQYSFGPVEDVAVFYNCGSNDNDCLMGVSDQSGELEMKFPLCKNGQLYAIKNGYSQSKEIFTTTQGTELKLKDYLIEPLKELDVEIKFVDLPLLIGNYYLSQGFSSNRCTGETVTPIDANLGVKDTVNENVIITSNIGPSQIALVYPENDKAKFASGDYSLSYIVEGEVVVNPVTYAVDGEETTLSVNGDGIPYSGSYLLGSYDNFNVKFDLDSLKSSEKITFYVPLEISSKVLDLDQIGDNIVQLDGSLYKMGVIDDDCDPTTPDKEVEIVITKQELESFLAPRLE